MSVQAMRWAMSQVAGSPTSKLVLVALAEAADENGYTFLGQEAVATRTELTRRAVITHMTNLADRGLIVRTRRADQLGRRTSDGVQLCLSPASQGERTAPRAGVKDVHIGASLSERHTRLGERHARQGERPSHEPSVEPLEEPLGGRAKAKAKDSCSAKLADELWSLAPASSRSRSSQADLRRAVDAALRRGGQPDAIRSGVVAYFSSPDARKEDGRFAKGVHRLVESDRWASFAPVPASAAVIASSGEVWRPRVKAFADPRNGFWNVTDWGARPGRPGCAAPAEVLAEFGFIAGVTPMRSAGL